MFTDDVTFWDPFRQTTGIAELERLFERWLDQYPTVGFKDIRVDGDETLFTMTYDMQMRMAIGPLFTLRVASIYKTGDGRVSDVR